MMEIEGLGNQIGKGVVYGRTVQLAGCFTPPSYLTGGCPLTIAMLVLVESNSVCAVNIWRWRGRPRIYYAATIM